MIILVQASPYITIGGIVTVTVTVAGWFLIHTRNHPVKKDIDTSIGQLWDEKQSTKFCDERTQRIEQKIDGVKEKVDEGFADLKTLLLK